MRKCKRTSQCLSTDFALSALWLPGLVSWSLRLDLWRVTWRGDTSRLLLLTLRPQRAVPDGQRHWLWRINLRKLVFASVLQELHEQRRMSLRSSTPLRCHCFGYEAAIFYPTSRAIYSGTRLQRHPFIRHLAYSVRCSVFLTVSRNIILLSYNDTLL
jgi:hypothetical protein